MEGIKLLAHPPEHWPKWWKIALWTCSPALCCLLCCILLIPFVTDTKTVILHLAVVGVFLAICVSVMVAGLLAECEGPSGMSKWFAITTIVIGGSLVNIALILVFVYCLLVWVGF